MKAQTKDPLSKPRSWIALYGIPVLIATGWIVGLALLAHLFFSPMPLDAAISPRESIQFFPAHPHEGAVGVPRNERARTVACGKSVASGREFDPVVAFDRTAAAPGRAIAESSSHHFADYNWDVSKGAPSFVSEKPGSGTRRQP